MFTSEWIRKGVAMLGMSCYK